MGITARVRALVYNPERVDPQELPRSLRDLTEARWKDRVGWSPTSGPTQTMITFMRHAWGEEETRRWLEALEENGAVKYGGHTSVVAAVHRGEVDVGLVNHYYVHRFREEHGKDVAVENHHLPEKGPGNLAMVSGAGVLRTARNEANAHAFLRYLLSVPRPGVLHPSDLRVSDGRGCAHPSKPHASGRNQHPRGKHGRLG